MCPYDSVALEILTIHKDFYAKQSSQSGIDEEFMTYPTAEVCFEDKDYIRFFKSEEENNSLRAELTHD